MKAVILATGEGRELAPIAGDGSPWMLPFLGRPLLWRAVDYLASQEVAEAQIVLAQRAQGVEEAFEQHPHPEVTTHFLLAGRQTGTAQAVAQAARRSGVSGVDGTLLVLWGDMRCDFDIDALLRFHKERNALVTVALTFEAARGPRFSCDGDGRVQAMAVPGEMAAPAGWPGDAGMYLIEPEALLHVPSAPCDLAMEFLPLLLARNLPIFACQLPGYWRDIGTLEGYWRAHLDALDRQPPLAGIHVDPRAKVHPAARLQGPLWIGPHAKVKRDAVIGPYAVLEGGHVRRGARLERTVVLPGSRLGMATRWQDQLLSGVWVHGPAGTRIEPDADVLTATDPWPWGAMLHQLLDSSLAIIGLVVLLPLLVLIAVAIYLDSPGPVLYTQLRAGQRPASRSRRLRGRVFEIVKFRTMYLDADRRIEELRAHNAYGSGPFFKLDRDPRITRVGHFLRKTSLDELPQLINVAFGQMRLVGNRPLPVYEAEALTEDWQKLRFLGPAGITGLWQTSGRSDLSEDERMALDTCYSVTRTVWEDWRILLATLPALLLRRGAR